MEVAVFETNGLPEGCILSIRAGNTRRQAPLPLAEPFRFPNLPFNARHFKVDVLHTQGSGRLDINAGGEEESYMVPVWLSDGSEAKVGLTVREQPSLCGKRAAELKQLDRNMRSNEVSPEGKTQAESTKDMSPNLANQKASKVARDTREYARDHNLHNLVQEMLQYVLRERPDAPYAFMSSYLKRKAQERGEKPQDAEALLKNVLGIRAGDDLEATGASGKAQTMLPKEASRGAAAPAENVAEADGTSDSDRTRLEAEHVALRVERAELLRELASLEVGALACR